MLKQSTITVDGDEYEGLASREKRRPRPEKAAYGTALTKTLCSGHQGEAAWERQGVVTGHFHLPIEEDLGGQSA